jgi:peptide/nickel transport system permease protein
VSTVNRTLVVAPPWRLPEHPWLAFAARRTVRFLVSLLVLVTATFAMVHLVPGDPVRAALGPSAPQHEVERARAAQGLDRPLPRQYVDYLANVAGGDLGVSISSRQSVRDVLADRLPATLVVALPAAVLTLLAGVPLGLVAGMPRRRRRPPGADAAFTALTTFFVVVPAFLLAVGLVYVFGVTLGWLPVAGRGGASSYVLPILCLAVGPAAMIARLVRAETQAAADEDYVRAARSKGLARRTIYFKHVMPNVLTAALTVSGVLLGSLIAGTVVVESVFAWPGIGATIVTAITGKDYALVQGIVLVYGAVILVVNLLVDVALAALDPRSTIASR